MPAAPAVPDWSTILYNQPMLLTHAIKFWQLNGKGRGGGASGRAMAFWQTGFESQDGLRLFWYRIAANLFYLGIGLFLNNV